MVAGALTGITAQPLTYPLDLLKTYATINMEAGQRINIYKTTMEIIGRDGLMGMYKGLFISNCGIAPFIGIKMASFDMCVGLTIGKGPDAQKKLSKEKLVYLNGRTYIRQFLTWDEGEDWGRKRFAILC